MGTLVRHNPGPSWVQVTAHRSSPRCPLGWITACRHARHSLFTAHHRLLSLTKVVPVPAALEWQRRREALECHHVLQTCCQRLTITVCIHWHCTWRWVHGRRGVRLADGRRTEHTWLSCDIAPP